MTQAEFETFARANALALELALGEGDIAKISVQLAILFDHARNFSEVELPAELEPLTVFTP